MPIKDLVKRREYQRQLMAKKRQGLTKNNVSPQEQIKAVRPCSYCQTQITNWYHLIIAEQEKNELSTYQIHQLKKQLKPYEKPQTKPNKKITIRRNK